MMTNRIFDTPVKIKFAFLPILFLLGGGVTWVGLYFHPQRRFLQGLLVGSITVILLLVVEFGHDVAKCSTIAKLIDPPTSLTRHAPKQISNELSCFPF
ncbi:MAG: hypothetical protein BGO78_07380 [Chloroflexi bacterium 44-23]|nr:MAG: hypothetical protein BGO78_07380 [Chloroflexi bacterium 44-23]